MFKSRIKNLKRKTNNDLHRKYDKNVYFHMKLCGVGKKERERESEKERISQKSGGTVIP